ncbi:MAG: fluoride efflux transporter CrcB [Cyanothece sp. SIO1E1]|nr:fluoride efflux transporter CrcB [Cyanothece sp. SIO1E1]
MLPDSLIRTPMAISLGAIAGALSRYYITLLIAQRFGLAFPYGTLFVNLTGCLLMGFWVTLASERLPGIPPDLKLMLTTGFLGAYTTFSTYGLDSFNLLQNSSMTLTSFYWIGSALLGIFCVHFGAILARLNSVI